MTSTCDVRWNDFIFSLVFVDRPGTKPPVVPKSVVPRFDASFCFRPSFLSFVFRTGVKPNNHRRSNTQTIVPSTTNGFEIPDVTETKATPTTRPSGIPPNARTRPPPAVARPVQAYRGSQTTFNNTMPVTSPPAVPASVQQRPAKKNSSDLGSTFTARQFAPAENAFLNDVSNNPMRTQVLNQRRTVLPQQSSVDPVSGSIDATNNFQSSIPRSASSLSQGRKSGIPTIGKQIRPTASVMTR